MVTLVPMPADVWRGWRERSIREYAADMARIGRWPAADAEARAARELARILPEGCQTPGHDFRSIVSESGETVGALWFAADGAMGQGAAFIWDIYVEAGSRGKGYGRAALLALEPVLRALGYDAIQLHVFGDNEIARHLYRSAGYVETDVSMRKRLG